MMERDYDTSQAIGQAYAKQQAPQSAGTSLQRLCSGSEELSKLAHELHNQMEEMLSRLSGPVPKSAGEQTRPVSDLGGALGTVDTRLTATRDTLQQSLQLMHALSRHI